MVKIFRFRRGKRAEETESSAPVETGAESVAESTSESSPAAGSAGEAAAGPSDALAHDDPELREVMAATTAQTRRGVLGRLGGLFRRGGVDEELWEELEEILIGADVGVGTATALIERVRERAEQEGAREGAEARALLEEEMVALLERPAERGQLWGGNETPPPPHVILVVGVNGAGKTTSIAKLASAYREDGREVLLGAADTFRAAAIEQLQVWGERIEVPVIASQQGADPGSVAYDTVSAAVARGVDVAIIDTAGRLQNKSNLMAELAKIRRVVAGRQEGAPHEVLLVLDATTGQNGLQQARVFGEVTEITAICLAKLDGTSKGGVVFAIADQLDVPVRFVGTGEKATDLAPFDARVFVESLFLA